MPEARPAADRRRSASPPDPEFAWMAVIAGAVLVLGGVGLTILSLHDADGRAALWIFLGTVGVVSVVFGVTGLVRAARGRSRD